MPRRATELPLRAWAVRAAALGLGAALPLVVACAQPAATVVAPVAPVSGDAATDGGAAAEAAPASPGDPRDAAPAATAEGAPARFRACATDADCVAAPRVGCCHNGWNEAVAASQKDAYEASFTCPEPHPICAMNIVRDTRKPRCDEASRLCTFAAQR